MDAILLKYFGYEKLKDKQELIIKSILDNNDTIGILATGYGKSICYQLPYLIKNKSVIVVSPLISLMEDQKIKLQSLDISVVCLNSNNSNKDKDKYELLNNKNGIIYISPEYLFSSTDFIKKLSDQNRLCLIAIDESHCISTWSEFRPEYKDLNILKEITNDVPILALTATATPKIISDIEKTLNLKNPNLIKSSFYRENLNINIVKKFNLNFDLNEIADLIKKINSDDRIIIYCKTKDETDHFVLKLKEFGIKSKSYHAGKTNSVRNKIQKKFMDGEVNIIIATIAFGMGIDLPNIRLIINYGISKDMESFYQEIGRAGRDGKKSDIYVYWNNNDINMNKSFLNKIEDKKFQKKQMDRILQIEKFVNDNGCRMKYITSYFGEEMDNCGHCDNCLSKKKEEKINITKESYYVLRLVKKLKTNFGTTMLCDILTGSNSKKINDSIKGLSVYGKLSNCKKENIKEIIRFLIMNEFLSEVKLEKSFGSVIKLSVKGLEWIKINKNLEDILDENKIYDVKYVIDNTNIESNKDLEDKLKTFRKNMASKNNVKLYEIFPNRTIESLLKVRINTINDLEKIDGLGKKRIEKYGEKLLEILIDNPLKETKKQNAYDKLLDLGLSLDEIASIKDEFINDI